MAGLTICVLTNDNHLWLLGGFFHQFNRYWPDAPGVRVFGFSAPPVAHLPRSASFTSLGPQLPVDKWTNGVLEMLDHVEPTFLFLLEDFWLSAIVSNDQILAAHRYFKSAVDVDASTLRLDLVGDSLRTRGATLAGQFGRVRVVEPAPQPTAPEREYRPVAISFQAAIWNRDAMRRALVVNESPWEAEVRGTERHFKAGKSAPRVLATAEPLLRYQAVYRSDRGRGARVQTDRLPPDDVALLKRRGWLR